MELLVLLLTLGILAAPFICIRNSREIKKLREEVERLRQDQYMRRVPIRSDHNFN